ncbi:MAG: hypothetical protein ACTS8Z_00420 [Candidatus Limnocylindrales bacterium]
MVTDRPAARPQTVRTFLAERYSPATSEAAARRDLDAARVAARELSEEGRRVTLIGCLLVAGDETVFSLFGAASGADVAAVGERTELPYDRISEGVRMMPSRHPHEDHR